MSARVPEPLRSWPVISGIGRFGSSGWYLKRYQDVFAGAVPTPGQATAFTPQDVTTVPLGTPKILYTGFFEPLLGLPPFGGFGGFTPLPPEPPPPPDKIAATLSFFAVREESTASFVGRGPSMIFWSAKRSHWAAPLPMGSAWPPARRG